MLPESLNAWDGLLVVLLFAGYWLVDGLLRREWLARALRAVGVPGGGVSAGILAIASLGLAWLLPWSALPQPGALRVFVLGLAAVLTWKVATEDVDAAVEDGRWSDRALALAVTAGLWWSPAFLVPALFVLTSVFPSWKHHGTFPLRLLEGALAFVLGAAALAAFGRPAPDLRVFVFFAVLMQASHYVITAFAKGMLGPHWYSWITDNRLHDIAASAYSWGWARFVPFRWFRRYVSLLRVADRPFQALTFALEALVPLALLHPYAAVGFAAGLSLFQVMVFVSSGILFWEWIVANALIAWLALALPGAGAAAAFGPHALGVGLVLLVLFPLRGRLWAPVPLGWWDTPLTQRVHWRVRGASGAWYGLYNDFLAPHERLYGRVHGCFLVETPVFTFHLGEVWNRELRDAIRAAAAGDLAALEGARERFGIVVAHAGLAAQHGAYLRRLFQRLNRGARKHVLPRWLRWMKAPGGQLYYWGDWPAYRGEEPVVEVEMRYREQLFDGEALRTLRDEVVHRVVVEEGPVPAPGSAAARAELAALAKARPAREVPEPLLEAHLVRLAAGRLVDIPEPMLRRLTAEAEGMTPSSPAPSEATTAASEGAEKIVPDVTRG